MSENSKNLLLFERRRSSAEQEQSIVNIEVKIDEIEQEVEERANREKN